MAGKYRTVEQILLEGGLVEPRDLERARFINRQTGEKLEIILVRLNLLTEDQVIEVWASHFNAPVIDLETFKVDLRVVHLLPQATAAQYRVVPLKRGEKGVLVAMADPFDVLALDFIKKVLGAEVERALAKGSLIDRAIQQYYGKGVTSVKDEAPVKNQEPTTEGAAVKFLDGIIRHGLSKGASDIHIEPAEESFVVRMRIDGILHDVMTGPGTLLPSIVSRIKVLSRLDIVQTRLPQDGRILIHTDGRDVSFRISTAPTLTGEKVVMRVLGSLTAWDLGTIGFTAEEYETLTRILAAPYGMVLVTGPTGSGKTSTLAAMLAHLNTTAVNILTIEDPVEYKVKRISQIQTDEKIGLSFAVGLRTALRQDPNVIMVGEIRDLETAEVGLRAALTGHLVLSTLHTNNAPATASRLVNMGIPPYLVSASLTLVISQKLIHSICDECRVEYTPPAELLHRLLLEDGVQIEGALYQGKGCVQCHYTGFRGRTPIFEVMVVSEAIRRAILRGADEVELRRIAVGNGMRTLRAQALQKAVEGVTTLSEVFATTTRDGSEALVGEISRKGPGIRPDHDLATVTPPK